MRRPAIIGLRLAAALLLVLLSIPLVHAASEQDAAPEVPPPNDRTHVNTVRDVRVTTAVPSAAEAGRLFGVRLYDRNIQPVWIKIENLGEDELWFLPVGLDESYFTPIETSYRRHGRSPILNPVTSRDYYGRRMRLRVAGGSSRSGYVFTRVDEGTKSFNVDIVGPDDTYQMTFFIPVPGLRLDHYNVDWKNLYSEDELVEVDRAGLAEGLRAMPCCVYDKSGKNTGDPLNIALVGDLREVYHAFMRAGWDETETIYAWSLWKTMTSALSSNEYRYSPISALYVFGRAQDVALQKARGSIHQRNHLRLWLTPMRYQGKPVWIGQISRDIGVRLTWKTITTHKIDPDVDETREYLVEDLAYAQSLAGLGYVGGVGWVDFEEPRGNLTGDPWFSDGLRAVLFIASEPSDISEIDLIDLGFWPEVEPSRSRP